MAKNTRWYLVAAATAAVLVPAAVVYAWEPADQSFHPLCDAPSARILSVYDHKYINGLPNSPNSTPDATGNVMAYNGDFQPEWKKWGYDGHIGIDYYGYTDDLDMRQIFAVRAGEIDRSGYGDAHGAPHEDYPATNANHAACLADTLFASDGIRVHVYSDADDETDLYLHLSSVLPLDDYVEAGTPLGYVGSTGRSTGPHLHLSRAEGAWPENAWPSLIDPYGWDADWQGTRSQPLDDADDPHFLETGFSAIARVLRPNHPSYARCAQKCGGQTWEIDDAHAVQGCEGGAPCTGWDRYADIQGLGLNKTFAAHNPTGASGSLSRWVGGHATMTYTAPAPPGVYQVSACFGLSGTIQTGNRLYGFQFVPAVWASYYIGGNTVNAAQDARGAPGCIPLGVYNFPGNPSVVLSTKSVTEMGVEFGRGSTCQRVIADVIRFEAVCGGGGNPLPFPQTATPGPSPTLLPTWTPKPTATGATPPSGPPTDTPAPPPSTPTSGPTITPFPTKTPGWCCATPWPTSPG